MDVIYEEEVTGYEESESRQDSLRSPAWKYFKLCTKNYRKAMCKLCPAVLKLTIGKIC